MDAHPRKPEPEKLDALCLLPQAEAAMEDRVTCLLPGGNGILTGARQIFVCVCVWYVEWAARVFGLGG